MSEFFEAIKASNFPVFKEIDYVSVLNKPIRLEETMCADPFTLRDVYRLSLNWNVNVSIHPFKNPDKPIEELRQAAIRLFKQKCYGHLYNQLHELRFMIEACIHNEAINKIDDLMDEVMK